MSSRPRRARGRLALAAVMRLGSALLRRDRRLRVAEQKALAVVDAEIQQFDKLPVAFDLRDDEVDPLRVELGAEALEPGEPGAVLDVPEHERRIGFDKT